MDILPSGNIFRELQDIQDFGYFSSQSSIEDQWQQASTFFLFLHFLRFERNSRRVSTRDSLHQMIVELKEIATRRGNSMFPVHDAWQNLMKSYWLRFLSLSLAPVHITLTRVQSISRARLVSNRLGRLWTLRQRSRNQKLLLTMKSAR